MLKVNSIFYSIQGEGPYSGCPAVFIRLSGCNLSCPMCDTDHEDYITMDEDDIIAEANSLYPKECNYKLAVITGGEPLKQDISKLLYRLDAKDIICQIETNGTVCSESNKVAINSTSTTVVCSPKTDKISKNISGLAEWKVYYKYVCKKDDIMEDGLPRTCLDHHVSKQVFRPEKIYNIFLQPADEKDIEKNQSNVQACVASCLKFGYNYSHQLHKLIGVE